ncbi:MAG: aspartyl protease family protein [Saprospirales bacterium]|nr:aspartyl protease family protein [Saprospirales bacterium]MBK8493081.1 aspartyl protease family protein [Saprospirales bacterium]
MHRLSTGMILALLIFLTGCGTAGKIRQLLQEGTLSKTEFRMELAFEERAGLIVIPVTIGGKVRHFLLDTGAPNVITTELAAELGIRSVLTYKVGDSQGKSQPLSFVRLDSLQLGELVFSGSGAVIADLDTSPELACLGVDGFIGSNLLAKTFLQIDYPGMKIILASRLDSLQVDSTALTWGFSYPPQRTPQVMIRANGVPLGPLTIDTGASGWIGASRSAFYQVQEKGPVAVWRTYGAASVGLFGEAEGDTIYRTWVSDLTMPDSIPLPPASIDFFGKERGSIGNAFLRQFVLTVDWQTSQLYISPKVLPNTKDLASFGFSTLFKDDQLLVRYVWENSQAAREGILPGDRILFMNGMDFINFDKKTFCRFFLDEQMKNEWEELDLLLEQDGATRRIRLNKEPYFEGI